MRSVRLPLTLAAATIVVFVAGNVLGYVTHDPETAGGWGGGGGGGLPLPAHLGLVGALIARQAAGDPIGWLLIAIGMSWAGAAVLRYRLYEIDVIVRRTVVYAVLVTMLAAVYPAGVTALGWIGREVTGRSGALAVTLSTLLVAASFQPLRARIRAAVDLRFYRRRCDAERAASQFASRLYGQINLDALHRELLGVIDDTVQPVHASLWLRD